MEAIQSGTPWQNFKPFFTIWYKPRATLRQILDTDPKRYVFILAAINGIIQALDRASTRNSGDTAPFSTILIIALLAGPIGGIISLYIGGALLRWTGSWIGGKANASEMRTAIAWSTVPVLATIPVWVFQLIVYGEEVFTEATPRLESSLLLILLLVPIALIEITLGLWAIFIMVKCIAEAHQFSAWKGLAAILLGLLVIVIPVFIIVYIQSTVSITY